MFSCEIASKMDFTMDYDAAVQGQRNIVMACLLEFHDYLFWGAGHDRE
jgi:hypothetical protein